MPVSYPIELPSYGVTNVSWTNATASLVSRSPFTFQGQAQAYPGAIRMATISVSDLNRDDAEDWLGFLDALHGTMGTFRFGDPMAVSGPRGIGSGNPVVNGANQSGDTLSVRGLPNSLNGWLRRGDWFQLGVGSNSRLYKVVQRANTSASGTTTLNIWPAIRIVPADGNPLTLTAPKGVFRRSSGSYSYTEDNGCKYSLSFDCEEVV